MSTPSLELDEADVFADSITYARGKAFAYLMKQGVRDLNAVTPEQWAHFLMVAQLAYQADSSRRAFAYSNINFHVHINQIEMPV
jgi:hypothetical protein